jgi:hypothetical protein
MFNRWEKAGEKEKQLAEGKQKKEFFSDPENLKVFQQYIKASASLRVCLRSGSLTCS